MQRELTDIYRRIADMRSNLAKEEAMFEDSRMYMEKKQDDISQLSR